MKAREKAIGHAKTNQDAIEKMRNSWILLLCLLLCACNKPQDGFQIEALDKNGIQPAKFIFDADSSLTYTTYFCSRFNLAKINNDKLKLFIVATSPSGFSFRDTVDFPLYTKVGQDSFDKFTKVDIQLRRMVNIEWTYRYNVSNVETGLWEITARPDDYTGLNSIGFSYIITE
jgi:hypothetical protein